MIFMKFIANGKSTGILLNIFDKGYYLWQNEKLHVLLKFINIKLRPLDNEYSKENKCFFQCLLVQTFIE